MSGSIDDISITRRQALTRGALGIAAVAALTTQVDAASPDTVKAGAAKVWVEVSELRAWTERLVELLSSGRTSLTESLHRAAEPVENEHFKAPLKTVHYLIEHDYTLSNALALHSHVFNERYITTVRYGEIYGELDKALQKWLDATEPAMQK